MSIGEFDDRRAPLGSGDAHAFPCTLLQERLFAQHGARGPQGLNVAMRWRVDGSLSHAAAEGALGALVRRHEILRTSFRATGGRVEQLVWPSCPIKLHDIDLSALAADEGDARAEEIARADAATPIDPERAPLLRATLLRLAPDRAMLLLTFHALVADGWSTGLIAGQFCAAARAIESNAAPDDSEPALQLADYALWERELLASEALDEARDYWRRQLRDAVGTEVPPDRLAPDRLVDTPSAEPAGRTGHIASLVLPAALAGAADDLARRQNVTLYGLAVSALALMLHRVTGERRIVFGSQVANREDPAAADLVGPTVNSITLCIDVDDQASARSFVAGAAETVRAAVRHERLPFEIAQTFAPVRHGKPLHAVNLVVHRSYSGTSDTAGETGDGTGRGGAGRFELVSLPSFSSGAQWPLNFYMIFRDEGWRLSCEADGGLYEAATAERLVEAWRHCLDALIRSPDRRLAEVGGSPDGAPLAPVPAPHSDAPNAVGSGAPIPLVDPARHVARFHEGGTRTPVIVLNNVSVYYQLARQLGEDRPFIDLMLCPPEGPLDLAASTFEDFGAYAVRLIRWAQPHGPYILGGHCVYGVLAFEAARQLRRAGEQVALVALFDSWAPGYREDMSRLDQLLRRQRLWLGRVADRIALFRKGESNFDELVRKPLLYQFGLLPPQPGPDRQVLPTDWFDDRLYDAVSRFRPTPYDGDTVLFHSNEPLRGRLFDEHMGWKPLLRGAFRKVDIDSDHFEMFRERPAGAIAAVLNEW